MPNTFGGTWHRPTNPQRGHSRRQLADRASYDHQPPPDGCLGCLMVALVSIAAVTAVRRRT